MTVEQKKRVAELIGAICGCACHTDPESTWAEPLCTRCDGTGLIVRKWALQQVKAGR